VAQAVALDLQVESPEFKPQSRNNNNKKNLQKLLLQMKGKNLL
jgi:hypothetical protein